MGTPGPAKSDAPPCPNYATTFGRGHTKRGPNHPALYSAHAGAISRPSPSLRSVSGPATDFPQRHTAAQAALSDPGLLPVRAMDGQRGGIRRAPMPPDQCWAAKTSVHGGWGFTCGGPAGRRGVLTATRNGMRGPGPRAGVSPACTGQTRSPTAWFPPPPKCASWRAALKPAP
jgi:hypothetical protein